MVKTMKENVKGEESRECANSKESKGKHKQNNITPKGVIQEEVGMTLQCHNKGKVVNNIEEIY